MFTSQQKYSGSCRSAMLNKHLEQPLHLCCIIQKTTHNCHDVCVWLKEVIPSKSLFLSGVHVCPLYVQRLKIFFFTSPLFPSLPLQKPLLHPSPTWMATTPPLPSAAQLTSLATLPPADRQLREPALLSKRATVEAWLTREANTLQKYRLVRHERAHVKRRKHTVCSLPVKMF